MESFSILGSGVLTSLDKLGKNEQQRRLINGEIWEKNGEFLNSHWSVSAYNQYICRLENKPYNSYIYNSFSIYEKDETLRSLALIEYIYPELINDKYIKNQKKYYNNNLKQSIIDKYSDGDNEIFQGDGVYKRLRI